MRTNTAILLLLLLTAGIARAAGNVTKDERVGKLRLGMSAAAVRTALGKPALGGPEMLEQATGSYVQEWRYLHQGITLKMSATHAHGAQSVDGITVVAPCRFRTSRGIGIGSPAAAVRQAYARDLNKESTSAEQIVVGSVYGGVIFTIQKGRVTRIFVGAAAE